MRIPKHYIVYHNKDLDGFCSGAIVKKYLLSKTDVQLDQIRMVGYNYGDGPIIPKFDDDFDPEIDVIYVVDLSLEDEDMVMMYQNDRNIWIDHHIGAIEKSKEGQWDLINGLRQDGNSASFIAWRYFFSERREIPDIVYYVDRYDVFKKSDHTRIEWDTVLCAQHGMRFRMNDPENNINYYDWNVYLDGASITSMIKEGRTILDFLRKENKRVAKRAFPVTWEGKTIAYINYDRPDIEISDHIEFEHDGVAFFTSHQDKVVYSLRKNEKHTGDILSLAQHNGGNGHERACGFDIQIPDFCIAK